MRTNPLIKKYLPSKKTREVLEELKKCRECEIGCGKSGGLEVADFYGGKPGGVMIITQNPGWKTQARREFILSLLGKKTDDKQVFLLRVLYLEWINGLLEKFGFKEKTIFQMIEEKLKERLGNLANRDSIYITDVCKPCDFFLEKTKSKKIECKFLLEKEFPRIKPKIVISFGDPAYNIFKNNKFKTIKKIGSPQEESENLSELKLVFVKEFQSGKKFTFYYIPLIHPSGQNRRYKKYGFPKRVKKALKICKNSNLV